MKALLIAGVATAATISQAQAADLLLPPPPPVQPAYVPVDFSGGFYLRGDLGAGAVQLRDSHSTFRPDIPYGTASGNPPGYTAHSQASEQTIVGLGAGYQFNHFFRADVTGEYRFAAKYSAYETYNGGAFFGGDYYRGSISNGVFLVNGYVDLGTWCHLTPYVGAGVGVAVNTFSGVSDTNPNGGYGLSTQNTHASFAYALMAGVSYDLSSNLKLDVGYRYIDMGRASTGTINCIGCGNNPREVQNYHLSSHDIRVGLRYVFADVPPPAPAYQPPLVRKY